MATVLNKTADAQRYETLNMNATKQFHATFYNPHSGAYGGDAGAVQSLTVRLARIETLFCPLNSAYVVLYSLMAACVVLYTPCCAPFISILFVLWSHDVQIQFMRPDHHHFARWMNISVFFSFDVLCSLVYLSTSPLARSRLLLSTPPRRMSSTLLCSSSSTVTWPIRGRSKRPTPFASARSLPR